MIRVHVIIYCAILFKAIFIILLNILFIFYNISGVLFLAILYIKRNLKQIKILNESVAQFNKINS